MSFWILVAAFAAIIYLINQHFFNYWSRRGFPYKEPTFLIGELGGFIFDKVTFGEFFQNIYNKFKNHKVVGIYFSYKPTLIIRDPLLIQDVLIKSFTSFHDRGFPANEEIDPLSGHLFSLEGERWRDLRNKISPTFTSGKLKGMFPTIRDCAQVLEDYITKNIKMGNDVFDTRELLARYTTSVISSVGFGIENDCINEPNNIFRKMGAKFLEPSLQQMIFDALSLFIPNIIKKFNMKLTPDEVEEFFMSVVQQTVEYREKNKDFERKDFMQLMVQLKNQGFLSSDRNEMKNDLANENDYKLDTKKLTLNEIAAQSFVFFIAGRFLEIIIRDLRNFI